MYRFCDPRKMAPVFGNGRPHRDLLRAWGGLFHGRDKQWWVPFARVKEAQALLDSAPILDIDQASDPHPLHM